MPRVIQHTPRWLTRPSAGHDLFTPPSRASTKATGSSAESSAAPSRKIAVRGTQVFVAVRNELRWSELTRLRDHYDDDAQDRSRLRAARTIEGEAAPPYRVLKVPVHEDIRQLVVSPNSTYLAIATAYTVHIALLPDPYHLSADDSGPIKLRTFQVGPTTHLVGRSPIVSVLWHPLGVDGSCLTTITEDATARLWEFDPNNRMSVNSSALALDMKRLANGLSAEEDFSPSKFGAVSFTAEQPYMEVAAACYGGSHVQKDAGWSTSTLWVAMKDGGLYALCPLLPSKFAAPPKLIDDLAAKACLSAGFADEAEDASKELLRTTVDQLNWANGVEKHHRGEDYDLVLTVFNRPTRPGPVPMLQGPFHIEPDSDAIADITDLFAIPRDASSEEDEDYDELDIAEHEEPGHAPIGALGVATSDGHIHVCLDLNRTEARWLPATKARSKGTPPIDDSPLPELLLIDTVQIDATSADSRPMFTPDPSSRLAFFVTSNNGVTHMSLSNLMGTLVDETSSAAEAGGAFRLKMALEEALTDDRAIIRLPQSRVPLGGASGEEDEDESKASAPSVCVALRDAELGDIVLTEANDEPYAAELDYTDGDFGEMDGGGDEDMDADGDEVGPGEARDTYQPAQEFWADTTIHSLMAQLAKKQPRRTLRDEVRITQQDLRMLTEAHHVLSRETHTINDAVSRLFGRTARLREEFKAQIERAAQVADKVDAVVGDDADVLGHDEGAQNMDENIRRRLELASERQDELQQRFQDLREQMARLDRRPLNGKEREWMRHVNELRAAAVREDAEEGSSEAGAAKAWRRLDSVRELKDRLVAQSQKHGDEAEEGTAKGAADGDKEAQRASAEGRRMGALPIRNMLERERALVEATKKKLEELMAMRLTE